MGKLKIKITKKSVLHWVILNIGIILVAVGVYFFKAPNNFATGGVSGISIVLTKFITPAVPWLGQTEIQNILNVVLLIIGFIFLGRGCTFKTAYCTLLYTGETQLLRLICPPEIFPCDGTLTNQVFLEIVLAMLLTGGGGAILFNCGGSSGGTDIIALIVKKYTKVNVGKALLFTDFVVAASTFFIFGIQTGLYSILGLFSKAFLVDGVIENIGKSKYLQIITSKPEEISEFILEQLHRGVTSFKAIGGYTGEEKTVLAAVCKRSEAFKIKSKIHTVDPEAFVIVTDTSEIIGKGFRSE